MKKIRIGVICPSEIAFRRFLPSLQKVETFEFAGVAIASAEEWGVSENAYNEIRKKELSKAQLFIDSYGGKIYEGYKSLVSSKDVDAVYLPLPPALHYLWAKECILNGKHALVEKPFSLSLANTQELISLARNKGIALHEDYMFVYHNQIEALNGIIRNGEIGKVRHYRIQFGFPRRARNDFRYNKSLGGGALYDAGGYTIKYANLLLGNSAKLVSANSIHDNELGVDIFGAATIVNDEGVIAQVSFGMDNDYKCLMEAWGATGSLISGRVLTAPDGFEPTAIVRKNNSDIVVKLPSDEAFVKSIQLFASCIYDSVTRNDNYETMLRQASFIDKYKLLSKYNF